MGKLYRYQFTKKMYSDYVVFLVIKGKYVTYDIDLKLMNYLKFDNDFGLLVKRRINYLILDDLDIIEIRKFNNNNYNKYCLGVVLDKVVKKIGNKLISYC